MKGVVFLGDRKLELREFPDPTPGPRWTRVNALMADPGYFMLRSVRGS